jgi:hypothetical protein
MRSLHAEASAFWMPKHALFKHLVFRCRIRSLHAKASLIKKSLIPRRTSAHQPGLVQSTSFQAAPEGNTSADCMRMRGCMRN